jgi:hypothetical protein
VPSDAVFEDFLARNRSKILHALTVALAQREPPIDPGQPDAWTESRRMAANLEAMQLLVSKPPGTHTVEDRRVLARYSGWGGLSLDKAQAAFPPSLQVDTRALIHDYYTPSPLVGEIARVTRPLLADLVGLDGVIRALEPSAGIGRFILAFDALGGAPIRWTAVEYSALAATLLSAVRPGLTVFTGPFERWVAQHWDEEVGRVNLVVSNPPFGQRGEAAFEDRDRSYREKTAMAYFLRRGLDLLAPGGLGIFIVPMGFMSDPKRRKLRETILLGNHVATAFRLPSQLRLPDGRQRDHFPGAHNVTDLIFFRRRAGVLAELDAEDIPVADGRYFEMVPRHVLGEIDTSYRLAVIGPPVRLPELIERPICQDCRIRVAAPRIVAKDAVDPADPRVASAQALARRVDAYLAAVAGARADDPALLWPELVDALRGWTARHGNPYDAKNIRVLAKDRDLARTFLRAFETDGNLIPGLRERPPAAAPTIPSGDLLALAEHIYRQERGLSVPRLLQEHTARGGKDTRESALSLVMRAGWCVDGPGLTLLLPEADYYTGDLWSRYDRAVQHPGNPQAEEQARRLLTTIRPALLHDLGEYSVREGWVPLPLIADWLGDTVNGGYPPLELVREGGLVQVRGIDYEDIDGHPRLAPLTINFLGWLNHDKANFTPERKKLQSLAEARDEKIAAWSRDFRDWILGAPERQRILLAAYNRVARGFVLPSYGDEPIYLARWTTDPKKQLFDYQRAGVRRLLSNRGGILVYDVGVGKTFTALATIAAARQEGWVRRPVVLVPNSLILQWRNEIAAVLPDYRVLLVGTNLIYTEVDGQIVETAETDKPEQRAQKWARFQAGEYDLALLTYSSMSRTKLDMDAATAIVHDTPAIMRQLALARRNIIDKEPKNRTERERAILEEGIPAWILDRLELQEQLGVRRRHQVGRPRDRPPGHRRDPQLQKPVQARAPRVRRARLHGLAGRGLRSCLAAVLSHRRDPPSLRRRRDHRPQRDPSEEQPDRALHRRQLRQPARLDRPQDPRRGAIHRSLLHHRGPPRGHGRHDHGDPLRDGRLQEPHRPAVHPHAPARDAQRRGDGRAGPAQEAARSRGAGPRRSRRGPAREDRHARRRLRGEGRHRRRQHGARPDRPPRPRGDPCAARRGLQLGQRARRQGHARARLVPLPQIRRRRGAHRRHARLRPHRLPRAPRRAALAAGGARRVRHPSRQDRPAQRPERQASDRSRSARGRL